jgi:hypothetical protein
LKPNEKASINSWKDTWNFIVLLNSRHRYGRYLDGYDSVSYQRGRAYPALTGGDDMRHDGDTIVRLESYRANVRKGYQDASSKTLLDDLDMKISGCGASECFSCADNSELLIELASRLKVKYTPMKDK